jgi:transcription antitermination factor NusG
VIDIIKFGPVPIAVPDSEIRSLQIAVESGMDLTPAPFRVGEKVQVESGALRGAYGTVVKVDGQDKLLVGISMFGRAFTLPFGVECIGRVA